MIRRSVHALGSLLLLACGPTETGSADEVSATTTEALRRDKRPKPGPAPDPSLAALPECTAGVVAAFTVEAMQPTQRGSDAYQVPTATRLVAIESSIRALLAGDAAGALTWADAADYSLCRGTGAEASLALWKPPAGAGQAQFAYRAGAARQAILEVPHPLFDLQTLDEGRHLFERLGARALIASGTHRCANSSSSGCSGTTTACDSAGGPYRISDMAHTEESAFHAAHRAFAEHFAQDWVFGVHGSGTTGVSVSDGTTFATDSSAPSAKVASALAARFAGVTSCNDFGGVPFSVRLCGTTDVQGRHLNASELACTVAASSSSRRFVHLEQSREVRDAKELVGDALDSVVP